MDSRPGSGLGRPLILALLMSVSIAGQWQSIFSKPRAFSVSKANLLTTLTKVPKEFRLSFEVLPSGYTARHKSLLHLSTGRAQDKMPELTVGSSSIKVESRINGQNVKKFLKPPPPAGQWTKVQVEQQVINGKYAFSITIGSKTTVLTRDNRNAEEFLGVKVYSGSPWASPASGQIRKLLVETKSEASGGDRARALMFEPQVVETVCSPSYLPVGSTPRAQPWTETRPPGAPPRSAPPDLHGPTQVDSSGGHVSGGQGQKYLYLKILCTFTHFYILFNGKIFEVENGKIQDFLTLCRRSLGALPARVPRCHPPRDERGP